jgi:hypothetical protein
MPAFLTRDGESLPQGMPPAREQVRCTKDGCEVSYTFRSDAPAYDARKGKNHQEDGHPYHDTKVFYWKGSFDGWRESVSVTQRKETLRL